MEARMKEVEGWVGRCQELINDYYSSRFANLETPRLILSKGRKYFKVVKVDNQQSVYAFVDIENLDILRPATYNRPAKHARGNILDNMKGMGMMSPYGPEYLK